VSLISNPHDRFFKEVFQDRDNVIDFIRGVFPPQIRDKLNFETLDSHGASFVDEELSEVFSDLVYTCEYNGKTVVQISLLFEHKSYYDKYHKMQILKYMVRIWESARKNKQKPCPVIPVVVYHGEEKWHLRPLSSCFGDIEESLKEYIPDFEYILSDFSGYSDEEIKNSLFSRVSLETAVLLMKNIHDEEKLRENLRDYLAISRLYFREEKGLIFMRSLIHYLYSAGDLPAKDVITAMSEITSEGGETAMSTATRLMEMGELKGIEKGIEKGREEGIEKGVTTERIRTVKKMLMKGLPIDDIMDITELSAEEIEKIRNL
jgi:predicted transposase/invertase (TIGR01784 family)